MGTVYAKERPKPQMVKITREKAPILNDLKEVRVDAIHITGIGRTKSDLVVPIAKSILKATNFKQVVEYSDLVCKKLEDLECFRNIEIEIDTSKGPKATPDGLEVKLHVKELKRVVGSVNLTTGSDEASVVVGVRMPNLLGRAEKIQAEYIHSNKATTNLQLSFSKPLLHRVNTLWRTYVYQGHATHLNSGYKEIDRGFTTEFEFNSAPQVRHIIQWDYNWRNLSCINRQVPFIIREDSGHTLKSSLVHSIIMDRRSGGRGGNKIFPTRGTLFELRTEYAGVGGNIGFLKNEVKIHSHYSLFRDFVLQASLHGGYMSEFHNDKKVQICDRFFLGGPLSIRGFEHRGAGSQLDGYALGSEMYWASGLHLYAPLPFRVFEKSFGELFRSHLFINAGNIGKFDSGRDYRDFFKQMVTGLRVACGAGVAVRFGDVGKLEFNYCLPLSLQSGDRIVRGFQFGIAWAM